MTREALQEMADKMGIQLNNLYASTFNFVTFESSQLQFSLRLESSIVSIPNFVTKTDAISSKSLMSMIRIDPATLTAQSFAISWKSSVRFSQTTSWPRRLRSLIRTVVARLSSSSSSSGSRVRIKSRPVRNNKFYNQFPTLTFTQHYFHNRRAS